MYHIPAFASLGGSLLAPALAPVFAVAPVLAAGLAPGLAAVFALGAGFGGMIVFLQKILLDLYLL